MSPQDRRLLELFAARVRALAPSASVCAFGSRARGGAHQESDFDLCVVVPEVTRDLRHAIYEIAWQIGFDEGMVLTPSFYRPTISSTRRCRRARWWRTSAARASRRDRSR
jgi:predicted nucleotidyltransferase